MRVERQSERSASPAEPCATKWRPEMLVTHAPRTTCIASLLSIGCFVSIDLHQSFRIDVNEGKIG